MTLPPSLGAPSEGRQCSRCGSAPRQGWQRWCRGCRTTHERERRQRLRQLGPRRPLAPAGPVLPPGVADLGFGVEVCGSRHQPGFPGHPCGHPFPARRSGQVYCCAGHGAGQSGHTTDCPLLQARQRQPVERVERPTVVAAPPPSASTRPPPTPGRASKGKRRRLWDPETVERLKVPIADVPKRARPPEVVRVSFIPLSRGYADVRVFRGGLPTRQGLPIHFDLLPDVIDALRDALRRGAEPGRVPRRSVTRDEWTDMAEPSARDVDGAAGSGRTGVAGMWGQSGGWGAWR
jgi:hypothetical protein